MIHRIAMTFLETIVVMAIILLTVALILPASQRVRESWNKAI
ncbi:MAG TPA: hypothetical protein PKA06_02385 [Gemmatales bacterium]|nr:hypothetical protein [Gemmatales bacterium]